MKADVDPPSGRGGSGEPKQDFEDQQDEAVDEFHGGRNWTVIVTLFAIIIAWTIGIGLMIWAFF